MRLFSYLIGCFFLVILLPSCRVLYPNLMFHQKNYQFFELAAKEVKEYIIQPGDIFTMAVFTRDGIKMIDILGEGRSMVSSGGVAGGAGGDGNVGNRGGGYLVDREGFVRFPILGEFYVKGYTETELERVLAEKLSNLFVSPYVNVNVINRRAFIFRGSQGTTVALNPYPTTLFEVITRAGGIADNFKAYKIKIIRGDMKNPEMHIVDLSTLEGMGKADLIVQANDIIYLEPRRNVVGDVTAQLTPVFAASGTIFSIIALVRAWQSRF